MEGQAGSSNPVQEAKASPAKHLDLSINNAVTEGTGDIKKIYTLLSPPIGRGAFGEERKAIHNATKIERAVKIYRKEEFQDEELKRFINEVEILKQLDHPNIIRVFEYFQDKDNFYIVTELCTGGELFDRIISAQHFTEETAKATMSQILSAVAYFHEKGIVHRDLKPESILCETKDPKSNLKVVDFSSAVLYDKKNSLTSRIGTVNFS